MLDAVVNVQILVIVWKEKTFAVRSPTYGTGTGGAGYFASSAALASFLTFNFQTAFLAEVELTDEGFPFTTNSIGTGKIFLPFGAFLVRHKHHHS